MLLPRPEIRMTMRFTRHSRDERLRLVCAPAADVADPVHGFAAPRAAVAGARSASASPTTSTMPMPQLNTRNIS